jgi:hypothetical protein
MELGQTVNTLSHNKLYTNLYNPWYAWSVVSDLRLSERCYNVALACGNYDHTNSVAKVIMTIKKGKEELDQYTLTRSEYANELGKTPNAVRMMMRHGKLSGEYRFDGSKYIFRAPERPRESYDNDHPTITNLTTKKIKKINRGNHFKADYPNDAFRLYNERKKEQAILNKIQGKFKSEAHELEYKKLNEEALKKSLENTEKKNKESFSPLKDYGGPVAMRRVSYPMDRDSYEPPAPIRKPFRGYDSMGSYDDGSVEIDVSRYSGRSVISEPQFKSKVSEAIWRLKNKK